MLRKEINIEKKSISSTNSNLKEILEERTDSTFPSKLSVEGK